MKNLHIRLFLQTPSIPLTEKDSKTTTKQSNETLVDDPKDKQSNALHINTKDGKLIVTASPASQPATLPSDNQRTKSLEINTKKGKLVVTATTEGDEKKLQNVVLERLSSEQSADKSKSLESKAESVGAAIDDINAATASVSKPVVKARRERVDFNRSSLERNFITPARAMSIFY